MTWQGRRLKSRCDSSVSSLRCHESIIVVEAAVLLEAKWNDLVNEVLLFAVNYS